MWCNVSHFIIAVERSDHRGATYRVHLVSHRKRLGHAATVSLPDFRPRIHGVHPGLDLSDHDIRASEAVSNGSDFWPVANLYFRARSAAVSLTQAFRNVLRGIIELSIGSDRGTQPHFSLDRGSPQLKGAMPQPTRPQAPRQEKPTLLVLSSYRLRKSAALSQKPYRF